MVDKEAIGRLKFQIGHVVVDMMALVILIFWVHIYNYAPRHRVYLNT
jgi:hypothetical protein